MITERFYSSHSDGFVVDWCSSNYYCQHSFLFYLIPKECLGFIYPLVVCLVGIFCAQHLTLLGGMQILENLDKGHDGFCNTTISAVVIALDCIVSSIAEVTLL
jgi:hypothetical protein